MGIMFLVCRLCVLIKLKAILNSYRNEMMMVDDIDA